MLCNDYETFKKICREFLPEKGCTNVVVDDFLSMAGITYRCKFNYKGEEYTIHCNRYSQWTMWDSHRKLAYHCRIEPLWEESKL